MSWREHLDRDSSDPAMKLFVTLVVVLVVLLGGAYLMVRLDPRHAEEKRQIQQQLEQRDQEIEKAQEAIKRLQGQEKE